eukprot:1159045-Pelagomonas_calceolata.AAC.1
MQPWQQGSASGAGAAAAAAAFGSSEFDGERCEHGLSSRHAVEFLCSCKEKQGVKDPEGPLYALSAHPQWSI